MQGSIFQVIVHIIWVKQEYWNITYHKGRPACTQIESSTLKLDKGNFKEKIDLEKPNTLYKATSQHTRLHNTRTKALLTRAQQLKWKLVFKSWQRSLKMETPALLLWKTNIYTVDPRPIYIFWYLFFFRCMYISVIN